MADVNESIAYVLHWEDDPNDPGRVTGDEGGKTRLGIAQKWHPELTDANFYNIPYAKALGKADLIYTSEYAGSLQLDKIYDQRVANKLLDMRVSFGPRAIVFAQQCVGVRPIDGAMGPKTLLNLNSASPDALLFRLANTSLLHYQAIPNRSQDEYESWEKRGKCLGDLNAFL